MQDFPKILSLLKSNFTPIFGSLGVIIGFLLFFNAPSILEVIAGVVLTASVFLVVGYAFNLMLKGSRIKSAVLLLTSVIFFIATIGLLYSSTLDIMSGVKYNQISGECEVARAGPGLTGKDFPWYYSECEGEALQNFCESSKFNSERYTETQLQYHPCGPAS